MWRRSNLPGNLDSDQSISEEEEEEHIDVSSGEIDMWPSENAKEEGGLLLQTKLEKLIGCGEQNNYARETGFVSLEATIRKISSSLEDDDVDVPDSPEESYLASSRRTRLVCVSAQESGSDDEIQHDDQQVATWSTISKETKSLIHLNGNAPVSSSHLSGFRAKRGSKDHVRPKFSFHSHTPGETLSKISDMAEDFEPAADEAIEEDPIAECPNDFDETSESRQGISVAESREVLHGFTEVLDIPPHKIRLIKRTSKLHNRHERKSQKFSHKGTSSNIQDSDTGDELPGPMDCGSSSDDEPSYQTPVPNIFNQKKQFVGDRFDEAIKASSLSKEGLLFGSPKLSGGSSLYGKLQQIMKQEKETEMEITKKLQGGIGQPDASSYVDVKIMSRHLEGKLVVCKCSVIDLFGDSLLLKNTQALAANETETRVLFSTKVCADVDIEIGNCIRLYAPWKELEVKKSNDVVILSSYFSSL
ncbi:PREDICTED: uncharacterized protein LOC104754400 isoform X2 [Camelina sativa]|uniref:Uncharacterized protein LOC104754400 isoform X2 n=1 Tax=Camelina sativa TaxID=90675 RepID=A0ABM1R873_CAMSA|nr:PREDICTED: uncharacterized protein LOC104754400 isoform X2 [Camelina sativa]